MTWALLLLLGYVLLVTFVVPARFARASWLTAAPRLAMLLWFALIITSLAGVLSLGCHVAGTGWGSTLWQCCVQLMGQLPWPLLNAVPLAMGISLLAAIPVRLGKVVLTDLVRLCRRQRACARAVDMVGRPLDVHGGRITAIEHSCPVAYCVAGHGGRVVLTTQALKVLPEDELAAVLEHEKAHLSGRHYALTLLTSSLARAFPRVPLFCAAKESVSRLVEMAADDAALRRGQGDALARALARLTVARSEHDAWEPGLLHASGTDVAARIHRLLETRPGRRPRSAVTGTGWIFGLAVLPSAVISAVMVIWC